MRDHRDLAIEDLVEQVASLEVDVDAYRALAQQALHALHELHVQQRLHEQRYVRLLEELRRLKGEQRIAA